MLTIRLQRLGKKNYPTYRVIISEKGRDTKGTYLEALGNFDPHAKEGSMALKTERIKFWLAKGAQTSNTVHNLFMKAGLITDSKKKKSVFISKSRRAKLDEKKKSAAPAPAPAPSEPVAEAQK